MNGFSTAFLFPKSQTTTSRFDLSSPADSSLLGRYLSVVPTAVFDGSLPVKGSIFRNWPTHLPQILGFVLLILALGSS